MYHYLAMLTSQCQQEGFVSDILFGCSPDIFNNKRRHQLIDSNYK